MVGSRRLDVPQRGYVPKMTVPRLRHYYAVLRVGRLMTPSRCAQAGHVQSNLRMCSQNTPPVPGPCHGSARSGVKQRGISSVGPGNGRPMSQQVVPAACRRGAIHTPLPAYGGATARPQPNAYGNRIRGGGGCTIASRHTFASLRNAARLWALFCNM